ncbi:MAG: inositol monophosphatase [Burkholderiales bacterium]|nr:inositol monophosphatase [Burkholderiales bacterium]
MHPMLNIAVKAARKAGGVILRASRDVDLLKVESKRQNDFVTEVDRAAEAAVIGVLREAYPNHSILGEESGLARGSQAEFQWIIDPLDGTTNFIHGVPQYCVSIGLLHKGVPTQAVIYDPNRNELFTATRGAGAFANDRRMRVSRRERITESLIGTGFPYSKVDSLERYIEMFRKVTLNCAGIRRPGAAALDLAYVAAGRFDGFWEMGLSPWDMAAGILLVTEAGGLVGNFTGEPGYMESGEIIAGNPRVFAQLVQIISSV